MEKEYYRAIYIVADGNAKAWKSKSIKIKKAR